MPMRSTTLSLLALITLSLSACAHNQWWEAERSGWVLYGRSVDVPRKAKPVPLSVLPEAAGWKTKLYVEAWVDSVDQQGGTWAMISDGTSPPVMLLMANGFTIPRNARGRRILAWGSPLVAEGSVTGSEGESRSDISVDILAEAVLIQGFYGLEPAPRPERSRYVPEVPAPEPGPLAAGDEDPASNENLITESTPAGVVDLPD